MITLKKEYHFILSERIQQPASAVEQLGYTTLMMMYLSGEAGY